MSLKDDLEQLSLNQSEISVYLALLENGTLIPRRISILTGIARTNCYHILESLEEKRLIISETKGKRKAYLARDPQSLLFELERKKEIAEKLIPDLRALFISEKNKPQVRFFEGWPEVKQIYEQTLTAEKIIAIGSTEKLSELESGFLEWYERKLNQKKIIFYDILTAATREKTAKALLAARGALHEIKFLPNRLGDLPTDILIWDNNLALITLEQPIFGTVLTSPVLVQTFRALFGLLWEKL